VPPDLRRKPARGTAGARASIARRRSAHPSHEHQHSPLDHPFAPPGGLVTCKRGHEEHVARDALTALNLVITTWRFVRSRWAGARNRLILGINAEAPLKQLRHRYETFASEVQPPQACATSRGYVVWSEGHSATQRRRFAQAPGFLRPCSSATRITTSSASTTVKIRA
jgi:hypothetical protein